MENNNNSSFNMNKLDEFKLYLMREGNKESSIKEMVKLITLLSLENPDFSPSGFTSFVVKLKEEGKINSYINHFIIAIRHWGKCFNILELAEMKRIKGNNSSFVKATMSDSEIEEFLALPYPKESTSANCKGYRKDRWNMFSIFWSILAYTGARPSEIAHLMVEDVDFGTGMFRVDGKTGKRSIPISFVIKDKVERYIKHLEGNQLFPVYRSKSQFMDAADWRWNFYERLKVLNIKRKNLTPYSLRHSFISRLISQDTSLFKVQKLVGHKQIETTAKYVHLNDKVLQEAVESDPLANKYKSAEDILYSLLDKIQELERNYRDKIISSIDRSIEGKMTIVFQVKK